MRKSIAAAVLAAVATLLPPSRADAGFIPGNLFDSTSSAIQELTPGGSLLRTIAIPGLSNPDIRGLAFGPDGLLYAVASLGSRGYEVFALNDTGAVERAYTDPDYIGGNISLGKIAFDGNGHFYVGDGSGLSRFTLGSDGPGALIYNSPTNGVFGVTSLPNGHLLITTATDILEVTGAGSVVRLLGNPYRFVDLRGLAYDANTNAIYATMLGDSNNQFQLMKLDGTTGAVINSVRFIYGDDVVLTGAGTLFVGSRTQNPRIYDRDLNLLGVSPTGPALFVTAAVPEPASLLLVGTALCLAAGSHRWTKARLR